MRPISTSNFGLLIAYLLPGFTCLWGLSYVSDTVRSWLGTNPTDAPTVGGFLCVTLASVAAGLTVSTLRWLVIDTIHHWTGVPRASWDFSRLQQNVAAYDVIIEYKYRYYQFYANTLIALVVVCVSRRVSFGFWSTAIGWLDLGFLLLGVIFFLASRDTYRKYLSRGDMLLGRGAPPQRGAQKDTGREYTAAADATGGDPAELSEGH